MCQYNNRSFFQQCMLHFSSTFTHAFSLELMKQPIIFLCIMIINIHMRVVGLSCSCFLSGRKLGHCKVWLVKIKTNKQMKGKSESQTHAGKFHSSLYSFDSCLPNHLRLTQLLCMIVFYFYFLFFYFCVESLLF